MALCGSVIDIATVNVIEMQQWARHALGACWVCYEDCLDLT